MDATAMGTDRNQLLDGAFEAVEDVPVPCGNHLEREVVVVAADLADPIVPPREEGGLSPPVPRSAQARRGMPAGFDASGVV